ncbi:MAG: hypothetical protein ACM359_18855, partial [Bacillota bacterium]
WLLPSCLESGILHLRHRRGLAGDPQTHILAAVRLFTCQRAPFDLLILSDRMVGCKSRCSLFLRSSRRSRLLAVPDVRGRILSFPLALSTGLQEKFFAGSNHNAYAATDSPERGHALASVSAALSITARLGIGSGSYKRFVSNKGGFFG